MPIPAPKYPLEDPCTTIFNNTLYAFTFTSFQSLRLEEGAQWLVLPMGVPVTGGVCVKSTPKNNTEASSLFIVGGKANTSDYEGLQRFTFVNGSWESIRASVPVTQGRLYHGAAYLNTSNSILVFAGTQDGSKQASSQTFTIKASEPYDVVAYEAHVPPAISPLVLPWTESKALYVGGSETNTKVMIFSPSKSWENSNATLSRGFYNTSAIGATVQNGNDASRSLYTFDMTVSPNSVNRTILIDGDGNPVTNSAPVVSTRYIDESLENQSLERRGNLTVANWPTYNNTLAPLSTRTGYAVARDQSGLTVITGGSSSDVLCIFKARDNCWVNATEKLSSKSKVQPGLGPAPSSSITDSPTSTATASGSPTPLAASGGSAPFPTKMLGAVLGSVLGAALIILALAFLIQWRRRRRQFSDAGHQRRSSGIPEEKDTMDFADRGIPQMSSTRHFRGHQQQQESQSSFSSVAILMGRVGGHKRGGDRGNGSLGSDSSSQFNKQYKSAISKPIPQEQHFATLPGPVGHEKPVLLKEERGPVLRPRGNSRGGRRGSTRRSSGWNRYWSGGSALSILGFGSKRATTYEDEGSDRSSDSHYSGHRRIPSQTTQTTQASAVPPGLNIGGVPGMHRGEVHSGSPTIGKNPFPFTKEMSGQIERSESVSSLSSYNNGDRRDAFSSGIPTSIADEQAYWTSAERQNWTNARAPSNLYSESNYAATTTGTKTSVNTQRETRFPTFSTSQQPQQQHSQHPSDMSWLNLGADRKM